MTLFSREIRSWIEPADVFVTLYESDPYAFWLDREHHHSERFSVLGHAPEHEVYSAAEALVLIEDSEPQESADPLPFSWRPGLVGWFDYWADPLDSSKLTGSWMRANEALVFDHDHRRIWLVGNFASQNHFDEWVSGALLRLSLAGGRRLGHLLKHRGDGAARLVRMAHNPPGYLRLIESAQRYIALGDVYQLCLTNRLDFEHCTDSLAVFLRLRHANPAPYAAYIRFGDRSLVCSSPEQFLSVDSQRVAVTRPIKGTRPRFEDPVLDAEQSFELASNQKERAENLMIVDLMRNDLARVSEVETVTVTDLFVVEPYATVHQLVSTVTAKLLPQTTVSQLIGSVFPGGSMTGAPKIRACQLIAELEGVSRGTYSGACGSIGLDGTLDLGMTIRSLVFDRDRVSIGVGGGITIDSIPEAELAETRLKARALLAAIGAEDPWS